MVFSAACTPAEPARERTIDFILKFAAYDDDDDNGKYTAIVYIDIRADGTPGDMLVTMYDNFNDNNAGGRNANIEATTVDESVDTAATIIVDLLQGIAATKYQGACHDRCTRTAVLPHHACHSHNHACCITGRH